MGGKQAKPKDDRIPRVYWDACIIISLIKNEQRLDPTETDAVRELKHKLDDGKIIGVTSAITLTEVLDSEIPDGRRSELKKLQQMPDRFQFSAVDTKVAEKAHNIRDSYRKMPDKDEKTVSTPDAIHLATAIIQVCDVFYTFDEKDRDEKKTLGLLPLSGDVAIDNLEIRKPPPAQQRLLDATWGRSAGETQGEGDA